jgi:pimeloyl-ACP methyl ester carboxylesterase
MGGGRLSGRVVVATGFFLAFLANTGSSQTVSSSAGSHRAGNLVIEPATLTPPGGRPVHFEIGTLYVPENRADPQSRVIGVGFARFKSLHRSTAPPIFRLPGGPGDSYLRLLKQGSRRLAVDLKDLEPYRQVSDVIVVDQRGFSERGDVLTYKYRTTEWPLDEPDHLARETAADLALASQIVAEYGGRGVDLRGYTIEECADDVDALRQALGYKQIILVGASFGSQWSFAVMRRHPGSIARALLSGVEPLDGGFDVPSEVLAAMHRIWNGAEKSPQWRAYLPEGGFLAAVDSVVRRFERGPQRVTVKDESTGNDVVITLGIEDLQRVFQRMSEPAFILSLYYGRYDEWAQSVLRQRHSHDEELALIGPLIDTGLWLTAEREHRIAADPATRFLGRWNSAGYLATGSLWPTADAGDAFRHEVLSPIPVVFVQGDWDRATPIENTLSVAPFFTNGQVVVVEHGEHALLESLPEQLPGFMNLLQQFLRTGARQNLPAKVSMPVGRFDEIEFPPPR